jgi:hypothetical protein
MFKEAMNNTTVSVVMDGGYLHHNSAPSYSLHYVTLGCTHMYLHTCTDSFRWYNIACTCICPGISVSPQHSTYYARNLAYENKGRTMIGKGKAYNTNMWSRCVLKCIRNSTIVDEKR